MSSQKHILFISSWYPNKNDPTHGIFNHYFAQAAALNNKVSVLHVSSNSEQNKIYEFEEISQNGITIMHVYYKKVSSRIPVISQLIKLLRYKQAFAEGFDRLIKHTGMPNLVQLNVIMPAGVGLLGLIKKHQLPYVINENWSGYCAEDGNYKGFFETHYTKKLVAGAKAIMPTSLFLQDAMQSHGLAGNYVVIPNVVNVHRFMPHAKEKNERTRLLHISSLTNREKNVSGIIHAFAKALQTNPALELNIVGDGEERKELEKLAEAIGKADKIHFKGQLLGSDLVNEINNNDCLVMFSHFETFCLVIIEAFACGKPVITSNAGAIKSYMKPELGIMVDKNNEEQLSQAILDFAGGKKVYDSAYIRNFAVANYSYEKVGQKLDDVYKQALETR